jgi:putative nucleotidyltransferase with HDIG domain
MNHLISREQILASVKQLPPMPALVHELEAALRFDDVQSEAVVQLVAKDQAMTVAALRLANSAFYGVSGRVVTLRDAVQILGMRTLSSAVTTAAVMACFDRDACLGFDFDAAWRHALASALCAQALARSRGLDECASYTCGLLHDIGSLALATAFPEQFAATIVWAAHHGVTPVEAEQELLGFDHAAVGGLIAAHWHFAPVVVDAILQHHAVPSDRADALLDALHLADNITHALDLSRHADDIVPPLSLATWERMGLSSDELQELFADIESRMHKLDSGARG